MIFWNVIWEMFFVLYEVYTKVYDIFVKYLCNVKKIL